MVELVWFLKIVSVVSFVILFFYVVILFINILVIVLVDVGVGYSILKFDCDNFDLQLRIKDVFGDFYENFVMMEFGDLVFRRLVFFMEGQSYQLIVLFYRNCYDNVFKKWMFDI